MPASGLTPARPTAWAPRHPFPEGKGQDATSLPEPFPLPFREGGQGVRSAAACVAYVIAKAPRAGAAKTRLCPPLDPAGAARLAEAFLLDVLAIVGEARVPARIMCRDATDQEILKGLAGAAATVYVQRGTGLGDALETAFRHGLGDGFGAVAVLGVDTPTLPPAIVQAAFAALDGGADVALGPSEDGGYYLLAARALFPQLFRRMVWSTSTVAQETLARCRRAGLRTYLLPTWYDVDDGPSLARLQAHLRHAPPGLASYTRAALGDGFVMGLARPSPPAAVGQPPNASSAEVRDAGHRWHHSRLLTTPSPAELERGPGGEARER